MSCSLSRENLGGGDVHENGDSQCDFATPGDFTSAKYATYRAGTICFTLKSRTVQNKISNRANVCAESTSGRDQCSRHRPSVHFRQTNSASTICSGMLWIGMKIAGTPTIAARLLMARRGSLETVVGALCVAVPGTLISASSARPCAAGRSRPHGLPAWGFA